MKAITPVLYLLTLFFLFQGCSEDSTTGELLEPSDFADFDSSVDSSRGVESSGEGSGSGSGQGDSSGLVTAGEWNDLDEWVFWND
ncbi:MAG: hypothetical protein AAGA86_12440, partial [Bacteroidota bacterium]